MTITITPNRECKACRGCGTLRSGSVPYGSTWVSLPGDYCDCVIEQLPEDDNDSEIELKFAPEVLAAWQAEVDAEKELFERIAQDYIDSALDEKPLAYGERK